MSTGIDSGKKFSDFWSIFEDLDREAYKSYKDQEATQWVPSEIRFDEDYRAFLRLTPEQQTPLLKSLVIFQTLDGAVIDEFVLKQIELSPTLTEKLPYIRQLVAEATHAESYKFQLEAIVPDSVEREKLIRAIDSEKWIQNYRDYIVKYMDNPNEDPVIQLVVQAFLEGVGFSALFAIIFWYKQLPYAVDVPGITVSNEWISREEALHKEWAEKRSVRLLKNHPEPEQIKKRIENVSDELISIIEEALPTIVPIDLPGMSKVELLEYAKFTADGIFLNLGYDEYYAVDNPLKYMETIGAPNKANFYERVVSAYTHGSSKK